MRSDLKQWQAFLGLQYQAFACKRSATLRFVCRCVYSAMLIVAMGLAFLRPGRSEAQEVKVPMPRTVLKTGQSHGKESGRFRFSPDAKLVATWRMQEGGRGLFGPTGSDPVEFKLWDVDTAEERYNFPDRFSGFAFSPDSKTLLIWAGKSVLVRDISTGNNLATLQHDEAEVISDHDGVQGALYIRNGELLITGATDRPFFLDIAPRIKTKFWNTSTWEETKTGFDASQSLYWPPTVTHDGKTLAAMVMGSDETLQLKIWDIDTGREEPAPIVTESLGIPSFDVQLPGFGVGPDTQTLTVPIQQRHQAGINNKIIYWDLSAKKLRTDCDYLYPRFSENALFPLSGVFCGDNAVSVTLTDNTFIIRDWQTEQVIREFINPASWQTTSVQGNGFPFRTDRAGSHLASKQLLMLYSAPQPGGEINFWNLDTHKLKETITTEAPVTEIAISNDGKWLAVRTSAPAKIHREPDRRVTIWDFDKRKEVFAFDHDDRVRCIDFSPNGKLLAIADSSHAYFREVATGLLVDSLNVGNTGAGSMEFSDDGQHLVVGDQLWNVTQRRKEWELTEYAGARMFFSPDGKSIAATSGKGIALINASDGTVQFRLENNRPSRYVYFTSDGSKLNIIRENPSGQNCDLWVLDLASRKEALRRRDVGGRPWNSSWNESRRMAMNRSANTVASSRYRQDYSDWEGEVLLSNVTGEERTALLNAPTGDIASVLFMPDGSTLASGGQSRKTSLLEIVDITTGKLVAELSNVMCETVSPDGEYLVTQHLQGGGLVLWKTRGGIELTRFPGAEHAQFSPDGTMLGTGEAGVLKLWNLADFLKVE